MLADAFLLKSESDVEDLRTLSAKFSNVISHREFTNFKSELDVLEFHFEDTGRPIQNSRSYIEAWKNEKQYPLTYRLARAVQVLPCSSVPIERRFSCATDVKTIKRNNLSVESIEACLLSKQFFGNKDFYFTEEMQEKYKTVRKLLRKCLTLDLNLVLNWHCSLLYLIQV